MSSDTKEKDFQNHIVSYLVSHGYKHRGTDKYVSNVCLDVETVLSFVKNTQQKKWSKFVKIYGSKAESKFLRLLSNEIKSKGTIHVLREGIRDVGVHFKLFYSKPNNYLNPDLFKNYEENIFSVIDELEYQDKDNGNRLDLTVFINGLPVITVELKDTFSQGVECAVNQYKMDRDSREQLFKNCLVHFAMSDMKIFMTTKLQGVKTKFLPFNRGIDNPEIEDEYRTAYLYVTVLSKDNLSKLISNYIFKEDDTYIFPRYHQLDCVNKLTESCVPGTNYLIMHSAGSGKTKTIAWLAHGLLKKFTSNDERVYDMVIVISDRKVIDKQLQDQVKSIEKNKGVVEVIDKDSKQLAESLKSGSNIVVTTLQKFPYVLSETEDLPDRKYAVIIDEAHSSQTGSLSREMHKVLGTNEIPEDALDDAENDVDELILESLEKSRNMGNISFFAFTATPKNKTLEMFGTKNSTGEFHPFHIYSMQQAIKEGFILDVLENYVTYPTYFKLMKKVEDDPEIQEDKAKKALKHFVEMHPHAIHTKTDIILTHFMNSSVHKIKGKARAMVVTSSRKEAVRFKKEFDKQIKDRGFKNIKTLVAFSGTVKDNGIEYTENSMNDTSKSIPEAFKTSPYRILIVANKYQTGFDEPLLHTMYVDKMLRGVKAVQSLSRLNRIHTSKNDTLIIDFANKTEDIAKSFDPYYQETYLSEETDTHKLYDLMENIYDYYFFYRDDVEEFVKAYYNDADQSTLHNLQNPVIDEFNTMDDEVRSTFKRTIRKYQNMYSFLSQLMPFSDLNLEKLYIYNTFLYKKLPTINAPFIFNVNEDVDIDSYKIIENNPTSINLNPNGELNPASNSGIQFKEEEKNRLSEIIKDLNTVYGTEFSDEDKVLLQQVTDNMIKNEDLINKIQNNSKENVEAVFEKYFNKELSNLMEKNLEFFKRINDNEKLRNNLQTSLLDLLYKEQKAKS